MSFKSIFTRDKLPKKSTLDKVLDSLIKEMEVLDELLKILEVMNERILVIEETVKTKPIEEVEYESNN